MLEHRLHPLPIGDQVLREVAVLDRDAFHEIDLDTGKGLFLDGHDPFSTDAIKRLGDRLADPLVLLGRDRRHVHQIVVSLDLPSAAPQLVHDHFGRVFDAAAQQHRVGSLLERLHPLPHDRLGQQRGGGRPVAGQVGGLVGDLADELRAHVLQRVGQLDLTRDRDTVVGDRRRAGESLEHDVAALGAERDLDRVGQLIHALLQQRSSLVVEVEDLSHRWGLSLGFRLRRESRCHGPAAAHRRDPPSHH